jgi:hypothetical protein
VTFQTACWAVDGNAQNSNLARLMLLAATLGQQGVVGPLDCIVNATGPATSGIIITPGNCVVLGQEFTLQGSYYGENLANDTTLTIAATGGTTRSDLIVVRAEDPTWAGSPWGGSPAAQILFPRVIANVAPGTLVAPGGISAIALARIDMPASTSVVQQSYIHDVRGMVNTQALQQQFNFAGPGTAANSGATSTAVQWPTGAIWTASIPSWATFAVFNWEITELIYNSGSGNGTARGNIYPVIGSSVTAPTVSTPQSLYSMTTSTGTGRHVVAGGGLVAIPPSIRGTSQTIQFAQATDGTHTDTLGFFECSMVSLSVEWQGLASLT